MPTPITNRFDRAVAYAFGPRQRGSIARLVYQDKVASKDIHDVYQWLDPLTYDRTVADQYISENVD